MTTSSAPTLLGYSALRDVAQLRCVRPRVESRLSTATRGVTRTVRADGSEEVLYPKGAYKARTSLSDHLGFALRYEPLDLGVLAAWFEQDAAQASMQTWLHATPSSRYARLAGHLFEWLSGKALDFKLPKGTPRIAVLDAERYVTGPAIPDRKYGVIHNLLGTRDLSPLVRRTPAIDTLLASDLKDRVARRVAAIDPGLLERALTYLYLAETQSSFAIERELPDHERRERFRRLLEQAGKPVPLNEDTLVEWHHEIITTALRREMSYRRKQNWLARGGRAVAFVPPQVTDIESLMAGVAALADQAVAGQVNAIIGASCASFGLVYVHPFLDGNGRLHRFLLHHILRQCGVTPEGVVLPISVALQSRLREYAAVLDAYANPRTRLLDTVLDRDNNRLVVRGPQPRWLYAYFDATALCELVGVCVDQALDHDLPTEVDWLRAYDTALGRLSLWLDGAQSDLDLLIRLVVQNNGRLAKGKRGLFERYDDAEIARAEQLIAEAFTDWLPQHATAANDAERH